jgi:hypothetical protein
VNGAVNARVSVRSSLKRQIGDTEQRLMRRRVVMVQRMQAVGHALWTRIGLPAALVGAGAGGFLLARIVLPWPRREGTAVAAEVDDGAEHAGQSRRPTRFDRLLQAITLVQVVKRFLATTRLNDRPGGSKGPPGAGGIAERADTMEKIPNGYPPA